MAGGLTRLLKRWRDNYYLSLLLAYSAKLLRFVAAQGALNIEQKVRKNSVTIRLPNGKNLSIGRNSGIGIASLLFWHGLDGFEPETSRTLRFFFERAATFIDVGANCGLYSILGALWNSDLRVIAFEPVPSIFDGLKKNVLLNRLEGRVRCENTALSGVSGRATLFLPPGEGLDVESTGTLASDSWQSRKGSPRLEVETVRFDEYEAGHPMRVDLIKIDVEDFEANVLEGMQKIIMRDRPFIVCEILPRLHGNHRTRKIVEALNYQPYWITPVGYIRVPRFDFGRGNFTDFLLSPVSTPDIVLDTLDVLWDLKKRRVEHNK
ncbi:MAG: FkbM family methyltransferase [Terriglobales bacterium]|jgi:FkbM family methyltransferase